MTAKFDVLLIMARVVGVPGVAGWSAGVLAAGWESGWRGCALSPSIAVDLLMCCVLPARAAVS